MNYKKYPTKIDMLDEAYGKLYRSLQHHLIIIRDNYGNDEENDSFDVKDFIKTVLEMDELLEERNKSMRVEL